MAESKIEWTDRSDWNPVRGCSRVSPGCGGPGDHGGCYAEGMAARFSKPGMWGHGFAEMQNGKPRWTGKVELQEDRLTIPLSWRKPAKVFVNSTSDIFHENLPDEAIDKIFATMALCPHLTFQILTKRPERMRQWFAGADRADSVGLTMLTIVDRIPYGHRRVPWPLPNVWLGVSCERQQEADERIPHLLQTPAAIRFVSAEPLLGAIDFSAIKRTQAEGFMRPLDGRFNKIDWIIVGGESGPRARPMHPQWARDIRDQCDAAGVAFFFKQWGQFVPMIAPLWPESAGSVNYYNPNMKSVGKKSAGRLLDGKEHNAFPNPRPSSPDSNHDCSCGGERAVVGSSANSPTNG